MEQRYPTKKYSVVGACGLDCGLCPRHHSSGVSACPGCCGTDFWNKHPGCAFTTCCVKKHGLETCAQCVEWKVCPKVIKLLESARQRDSVISYKPVLSNLALISDKGIEEFVRLALEKKGFLRNLIENYDDGRSKSFYCTACQLLPLERLKEAVTDADARIATDTSVKEKAKIMRAAITGLADSLKIDLKLRK